ncbi:baculoviral IAP repeat-containing protein 7-B [Danaus plexippus]|uniref:baculoviral IAP repeat-containing protein 7-B n=1 Tax=Danaus plexippus TaxID=13037 RepID=UPI002AB258E5|nr:baculoviral IAP repeat-containing protein 7-B [Danaus plexippus]
MNREANRINTFTNWPTSAPVEPARIAKAGFFYTGQGTEVQCFSCGRKISEWNYADQVMWRHRTLEPNCAFVVNPVLSGNVPLVLGRECSVQSNRPSEIEEEQSQDYGLTEEDEMYKSDSLRLLSFVNWYDYNDDSSVSREELVSAGFYHAGEGRLRCAWCGGELAHFRRFGSLDPPLEVHRRYFPRCSHAAALEMGRRNMSAVSSPLFSQPLITPVQSLPLSIAPQTSGAQHNARVMEAGGEWRSLGVVGGGARHPTRAALAARLATFERWPADRAQAPKALAAAGFFYTGIDDQVRCFYCDGGLGKWESGDAPWSEHARWFPHCGYVLLVKGREFVDSCRRERPRPLPPVRGTRDAINYPITESQIDECMESGPALAALSAGLDAARVRRAVVRRLQATGTPFTSSEALIDAVLDGQLNEEAWLVSPSSLAARDLLAGTLRGLVPTSRLFHSNVEDDRSDSRASQSDSPVASPTPSVTPQTETQTDAQPEVQQKNTNNNEPEESMKLSLQEENRQLKEARMCKVCMDSEVSVVFLPCGHLVSCAGCGAALGACPLCRAPVKALVRAYLA